MNSLKVIAFDADDTLWVNEPYFQEVEARFCALLEDFMPHHSVSKELLRIEIANLELYGFGVKSFMLSMVQAALEIMHPNAANHVIEKVIALGKEMLDKPIELLPNVREVLESLQGKYKLVVATKGDLLDQERKLRKSGLETYFHHIEIMSDKQVKDYQSLMKQLDLQPNEFMMIGNSLKSDVYPVLEIGGFGVHVPYHTTWAHEIMDIEIKNENFKKVENVIEILNFL